MPKYIIISGGVVSGLGKGITASSIGLLLKECGLRVTSIKIDPYLNIDAGTMSPYEHGEVFVLDDGGEADLDLGNYERFLDINLTRDHNITTGKVYDRVLKKERKGSYLGKTVQVVPHITDAIQEWISKVANIPVDDSGQPPDVCIIELGGTVGDIESMVFLEALRQFEFRVGRDNFCHVHVSLVTVVGAVGEQKSKPTQQSIRNLRTAGLLPHMVVCRSKEPLTRAIREKISLFGMVPSNMVFSVHDVANIYQVPHMLLQQKMPSNILSTLRINKMPPLSLPFWDSIACKSQKDLDTVTIGLVGKYTGLADSYLSVTKALRSAALAADRKLKIVWVDAEKLQRQHRHKSPDEHKEAWDQLMEVDGILCPGGFGNRGIEGKIAAAKYARENNVPYLGICLGMQLAVIEFARHILGWKGANSTEFDPDTKYPVVIFMPEISPNEMGGNMRLGSRCTVVKPNTLCFKLYDNKKSSKAVQDIEDNVVCKKIFERHRHRYEVNNQFIEEFEKRGLIFSGHDELGVRMECIELKDHKYFVGTQFHPEFKSRPVRPSPPFVGLIRASCGLPLIDDPMSPTPSPVKRAKLNPPEDSVNQCADIPTIQLSDGADDNVEMKNAAAVTQNVAVPQAAVAAV